MNDGRPADDGLGGDWPLVLFTALAIAGAGLVLAPLAAAGDAADARPLVWGGILLIAAGFVVSLAHLGQPWRAPRAAAGLGRSRLSAEVVLAVATLAAAGAALALPSWPVLSMSAAALAGAFLLSLGFVYALRGQPAWRGAVSATPLSMALPLAVLASAALGREEGEGWRAVTAALLAADLVLFLWRTRRLATIVGWWVPVHPAAFRRRAPLLALRVALVTLAPLLLALAGLPLAAATALALGILVDRVGFYALAVRSTTEAEIAGVEELIASGR